MNEVVKPRSSVRSEPDHSAGSADGTMDLGILEPGHPTGRADVQFGDDAFENRLEDLKVEFRAGNLGTFRTEIHAGPLSPVPLVLSGCVCCLVLHLTGAPEWAQLTGVLLPWIIALSWVAIRALGFRHGRGFRRGERG